MSAPDLTEPIYDALLANTHVTGQLPAYLGSFPIFTRRPVPDDAPYPLIIVSQDITLNDEDGVDDFRPIITRDVAVYHLNQDPANFRLIDRIAQQVRFQFHRKRQSITVPGWAVVDIQAAVPIAVEVEQDQITGRVVQLNVRAASR